MKVALVYPPFADATQPYSSLPALAGYLRCRTRHEVALCDANLDFVLHSLTRDGVEAAAARITERIGERERADGPPGRTDREYALALAASLKAPIVAARIEDAVAAFRSADTFSDLPRLDRAKRLYDDAIDVLSAAWSPVALRAFGPWHLPSKPSVIESLACDAVANPFLSLLETRTLPDLLRSKCGAVGISITYPAQVLAAVTLAKLVRRHMPGVALIFGGHIPTSWYEGIERRPEIFEWCDYLVAFEGETALDRLLDALERGHEPSAVPNLAYMSKSGLRKNAAAVEDIDALPTPDYAGLPLDRYLAPEPVFLLNTSRGCYWSKCEFCAVSPALRNGFRMRSTDLVIRDMAALQQRHAAHCFSFGDDCVPPRTLRALAHGLIGAGIRTSWQCEVRFERAITHDLLAELRRAGCRNLIFGLESYSARVLGLMKKGVRLPEIDRILDGCRRNQIAFNLQLFFGFPGETAEEARQTLEFVAGHLHGAATASFGEFQLMRGSGLARRPDAFGIRPRGDDGSLATSLDYEPVPAHACVIKDELRDRVLGRSRFKSLPLRIDAHTLLYLHHAGVPAMASDYYGGSAKVRPATAAPPGVAGRYVRKPWQSLCEIADAGSARRVLLYDYELERAVEISGLAQWVVTCGLDRPRTVGEVADELASATGEPYDSVLSKVTDIMTELLNRDLLEVMGAADSVCPST